MPPVGDNNGLRYQRLIGPRPITNLPLLTPVQNVQENPHATIGKPAQQCSGARQPRLTHRTPDSMTTRIHDVQELYQARPHPDEDGTTDQNNNNQNSLNHNNNNHNNNNHNNGSQTKNEQIGHVVLIQEPDLVHLLSLPVKPTSESKVPTWLLNIASVYSEYGYDDDNLHLHDAEQTVRLVEENPLVSSLRQRVEGQAAPVEIAPSSTSTSTSLQRLADERPRRRRTLYEIQSRDSGCYTYVTTIRQPGRHRPAFLESRICSEDYSEADSWTLMTAPPSLGWSSRTTDTISTRPGSDISLWSLWRDSHHQHSTPEFRASTQDSESDEDDVQNGRSTKDLD